MLGVSHKAGIRLYLGHSHLKAYMGWMFKMVHSQGRQLMLAFSWELSYDWLVKGLHMAFPCDLDFSYQGQVVIECPKKECSKISKTLLPFKCIVHPSH